MSTTPFWRDPVFWIVLVHLDGFWVAGFFAAWKNNMATVRQMVLKKGKTQGLPWVWHFGFWYLVIALHPVLAWATAKMWLLWRERLELMVACLIVASVIGYILQHMWSKDAGSDDAWSEDGWPNTVGKIHIMHMVPEVGIMLMLLVNEAWFWEMPILMFVGLLAFIALHVLLGTHWPIRVAGGRPTWVPEGLPELGVGATIGYIVASSLLFLIGIFLLEII